MIHQKYLRKKIYSRRNFFQKLPQLPRTLHADPIECNEMYFFIQQNRRLTSIVSTLCSKTTGYSSQPLASEKYVLWRSLAADLRLFPGARQIPPGFSREIRHLDHTYSREMHKVAVIYVSKGQEVSLLLPPFFFITFLSGEFY